ncbi:MAG: SDR family oxidoreductase [Cryobacterium sp.]|nr:SDR family oxidoreductase [Cryobacterium sp.]
MTQQSLHGKVVLVFGGGGGIGGATAREMASQGAAVEVADLTGTPAVDVTDMQSVTDCVAQVVEAHNQLDAVVVASGLLVAGTLDQMSVEDFDRVLAVNLRGAFTVAKCVAPALRDSKGSLVFVGSTSSIVGSQGQSAYCAAKAGVANLSRSLADELASSGVRVNCVCPGWVDTAFNDDFWRSVKDDSATASALMAAIPMRRQATPEEIAPSIAFLCSEGASYITGSTLLVDGGLTAVR